MAYPTLAEAKAFIGISGTDEDSLLTGYLNSAVSMVERMTDREFVANYERRFFNIATRDIYMDGRYWHVGEEMMDFVSIDFNYTQIAGLQNFDLTEGNVKGRNFSGHQPEHRRNEKTEDPPFTGLYLDDRAKVTWNALAASKYRVISLHCDWGYTYQCPEDIKLAIRLMVEGMYRKRKSRISAVSVSRSNAAIGEASWVPAEAVGIIQSYVRFR